MKLSRTILSISAAWMVVFSGVAGCVESEAPLRERAVGAPETLSCETPDELLTRRSLVVTHKTVLAEALPFEAVMKQLVNIAQPFDRHADRRARNLFRQWFDTQTTAELGRFDADDYAHCDDERTEEGAPALNGFAHACPRGEAAFATTTYDPFGGSGVTANIVPVGAFNRLDLAPADFSTCGEYRIVYAVNELPAGSSGRLLMIFEAELPNPQPGCASSCRQIAQRWADLSALDPATVRGRVETVKILKEIFLEGVGTLPPVVHWEHYAGELGQLRTNQFVQGAWTLREFNLEKRLREVMLPTAEPAPRDRKPAPLGPAEGGDMPFRSASLRGNEVVVVPTPVDGDADVSLYNLPDDAVAASLPAQWRDAFMAGMDGLLANDLNLMGLAVDDAFKSSESRMGFSGNLGPTDYGQASSIAFKSELAQHLDPNLGLTVSQLLNRATFTSCAGCHQNSVGFASRDLGGGIVFTKDMGFVHVLESGSEPCDAGDADPPLANAECYRLSSTLKDTFLPARKAVLETFLQQTPGCGPCTTHVPGEEHEESSSSPESAAPAPATGSQKNLAGKPYDQSHG